MYTKKTALCALLVLWAALAFAAPFGFEMGMSLDEVREACGGRRPLSYGGDLYMVEPDQTHPAFSVYMVRVSPTEGLYFALASTDKTVSVMTGELVREQFASLKDTLCNTYGACREVDQLKEGSTFTRESEWMTALAAGERKLRAAWNRVTTSRLPDDTRQIVLAVSSVSSFEARVSVSYTFANYDKAMREVNRAL